MIFFSSFFSSFFHSFFSLCSIHFCFGPVGMRQFKNKFSGLKTDWGSPPGCSDLRNAYYVPSFCRLGLQTIDNGFGQTTRINQKRSIRNRFFYLSSNSFASFLSQTSNLVHRSLHPGLPATTCIYTVGLLPVKLNVVVFVFVILPVKLNVFFFFVLRR